MGKLMSGGATAIKNLKAVRHLFTVVRVDAPSSASIATRGLLSTAGVFTQGATRFLTNTIIGRIGGPSVLGAVGSAISTAQLFTLLWPATMGSAASKFVARARGAGDIQQAEAISAHLARRTLQASVLLATASIAFWLWFDGGHLAGALSVAVLVLGYSGYNFSRGLQFGAGQVPRATAWDVLTGLTGLAGVLLALLTGVRGLALVLPLSAASAAFAAAGWPWRSRGKPSARLRREIDGFVALGAVGTVASAGFLQLSMLVARQCGGADGAGQFAAALTLATPPSLLAGSLSLVLFPSMAEAWGRGDAPAFVEQTNRAFRLLLLVMVGLFGALVICSPLIVKVVWGSRFGYAAELLPVLLLAVMTNTLGVACTNALTTQSQRGMVTSTISSLTGMFAGAVVWLAAAPKLGVMGVAIGYLVGTLLITAIPIALVWRRDGHQWAALAFRLAAGLLILGALFAGEVSTGLPLIAQPAVAAAYLCLWAIVMRRELFPAAAILKVLQGRLRH